MSEPVTSQEGPTPCMVLMDGFMRITRKLGYPLDVVCSARMQLAAGAVVLTKPDGISWVAAKQDFLDLAGMLFDGHVQLVEQGRAAA